MIRSIAPVVFLASCLAGCRTEINGPLESGNWGGTGASVVVSSVGTAFEFDCAHGRLEDRLVARDGRFAQDGMYVREHGGPVPEESEEDAVPAVYEGEIRGTTMSLYVVPEGSSRPIGPYLLERGAQPLLRKCL